MESFSGFHESDCKHGEIGGTCSFSGRAEGNEFGGKASCTANCTCGSRFTARADCNRKGNSTINGSGSREGKELPCTSCKNSAMENAVREAQNAMNGARGNSSSKLARDRNDIGWGGKSTQEWKRRQGELDKGGNVFGLQFSSSCS